MKRIYHILFLIVMWIMWLWVEMEMPIAQRPLDAVLMMIHGLTFVTMFVITLIILFGGRGRE